MANTNYNISYNENDPAIARVRAMQARNKELVRRSNEAMQKRRELLLQQQKDEESIDDKDIKDNIQDIQDIQDIKDIKKTEKKERTKNSNSSNIQAGSENMNNIGASKSNANVARSNVSRANTPHSSNTPNMYNMPSEDKKHIDSSSIDISQNNAINNQNENSSKDTQGGNIQEKVNDENAVPTMARVGNKYDRSRNMHNPNYQTARSNGQNRSRQTRTYSAVGSPFNQPNYPGMNRFNNSPNSKPHKPPTNNQTDGSKDKNPSSGGLLSGLKNNPLFSSLFNSFGGKDKKSPVETIKGMTGGILDNVKGFLGDFGIKLDGENSLIILVILILASENKDPLLILALAYLLF